MKNRFLLSISNIEFDTPLEFRLALSADAAIEMLSNSSPTPYSYWFPISSMQGTINDKRFKIWTKMIRLGPSFAILEGEVFPLDEGSKIEACIRAARWARYFKVNPIIFGILGILFFLTGINVMLDTKYMTFELWISGTIITIYCIGIYLFVMNFAIYAFKKEKEDLENFMKGIFSNFLL